MTIPSPRAMFSLLIEGSEPIIFLFSSQINKPRLATSFYFSLGLTETHNQWLIFLYIPSTEGRVIRNKMRLFVCLLDCLIARGKKEHYPRPESLTCVHRDPYAMHTKHYHRPYNP